jgi:hypothetical protein
MAFHIKRWLSYQGHIWEKAAADWKSFLRRNLAFNVVFALAVIAVNIWLDWHLKWGAFSVEPGIVQVVSTIGASAILAFSPLIFFRFLAPFRRSEEQQSALAEARSGREEERSTSAAALTAIRESHAQELATLAAGHLRELSASGERYAALERQYNEIRAARPRLTAGLLHEFQELLVVPITNDGAPARRVWAKLSVTGNTWKTRLNVYGTWRGAAAAAQEIQLGAGETHDIVVARSGRGEAPTAFFYFYYWVPFIEHGQHDETRALVPSWPRDPHQDARQNVRIEIFSEPESDLERISFSLTLIGCDRWENARGVTSGAFPVAAPWEAYSDPWNDFFVAAGEIIVKFHNMQGVNQLPAQDWELFRSTAGHASVFAERLPEVLRDQARALVQPFLEVEQANLDSCAAAVAELQSFIFQHQYGVSPDAPVSES